MATARGHAIPAGAAALIPVLGALLIADGAPAAAQPPLVMVATTGNQSERMRTLPIARRKGGTERVVMSMKPNELPDPERGDRLAATAEVQFTANCVNNGFPRCVGPAYKYNPIIHTSLVLAEGKNTTGGKRATRISKVKRDICRQKLPAREHHCVITITDAGLTLREGKRLPCKPRSCRVNLVVSVHHPRAGGRDLIMVGGQQPDGSIPQDRGRINVIRFRPADQPPIGPVTSDARVLKRVPPDFRRRVIYSMRLNGLRAGEQLDVSAKLKTKIKSLPYNVRTSAQLILAAAPDATHANDVVRRAAQLGGEIDELNGFNCTQNRPSCTMRKVGIARIQRNVDGPLFVNLYTILGPKRTRARSGDRVKVAKGGGLRIVRYPAELRG